MGARICNSQVAGGLPLMAGLAPGLAALPAVPRNDTGGRVFWLRRRDLHPRPFGYEPNELLLLHADMKRKSAACFRKAQFDWLQNCTFSTYVQPLFHPNTPQHLHRRLTPQRQDVMTPLSAQPRHRA